jgi:hypothetical protein
MGHWVHPAMSKRNAKHTAAGIPTWSPTVVLICRSTAYVWQSGRDAQFSADYGRMCLTFNFVAICFINPFDASGHRCAASSPVTTPTYDTGMIVTN